MSYCKKLDIHISNGISYYIVMSRGPSPAQAWNFEKGQENWSFNGVNIRGPSRLWFNFLEGIKSKSSPSSTFKDQAWFRLVFLGLDTSLCIISYCCNIYMLNWTLIKHIRFYQNRLSVLYEHTAMRTGTFIVVGAAHDFSSCRLRIWAFIAASFWEKTSCGVQT